MNVKTGLLCLLVSLGDASVVDRQLLEYASIPSDAYSVPVPKDTTTLLNVIQTNPELSNLSALLSEVPGMVNTTYTKVAITLLWDSRSVPK